MTSIWSEGIIKWTSMTAYLPLCSLAGVVAYWRARQGDSKKRIIAVCMVFALVPILNSAFYALNSSYYARWFYMPVLILAAMTVSAWEDPSLDLARPARSIAFVMIATLAFALVPVQDATTKEWSLGVLQNPGQYCAVLAFGLGGLAVYHYLQALAAAQGLCPPPAGRCAGVQLPVRHRPHRHWQVRPVEHRQ